MSSRDTFKLIKRTSFLFSIHIRRTDKINSEGGFHATEEYLTYVCLWYSKYMQDKQKTSRKVYVMTDDASVPAELEKK